MFFLRKFCLPSTPSIIAARSTVPVFWMLTTGFKTLFVIPIFLINAVSIPVS